MEAQVLLIHLSPSLSHSQNIIFCEWHKEYKGLCEWTRGEGLLHMTATAGQKYIENCTILYTVGFVQTGTDTRPARRITLLLRLYLPQAAARGQPTEVDAVAGQSQPGADAGAITKGAGTLDGCHCLSE